LQREIKLIGWEAVMEEGLKIGDQIANQDLVTNMQTDDVSKAVRVTKMFATGICFALGKHKFALANLCTLIANINVRTPSASTRRQYELLVVPLGFMNRESTLPEKMYHYISGTQGADEEYPIRMKMETAGYTLHGLKVVEYVNISDFQAGGTSNPEVKSGPLDDIVTFAVHYVERHQGVATDIQDDMRNSPCQVVNFDTDETVILPTLTKPENMQRYTRVTQDQGFGDKYIWWLRPQIAIMAESIVAVANPGPETGEIVMQWPKAAISTSQMTESLEATLRVYAGAYLKYKENVLIVNAVRPKGYIGGGGARTNIWDGEFDEEEHDLLAFATDASPNDQVNLLKSTDFQAQCEFYGIHTEWFNPGRGNKRRTPVISLGGTTFNRNGSIRTKNKGHLGVLEHPDNRKSFAFNPFNSFTSDAHPPAVYSGGCEWDAAVLRCGCKLHAEYRGIMIQTHWATNVATPPVIIVRIFVSIHTRSTDPSVMVESRSWLSQYPDANAIRLRLSGSVHNTQFANER
jgi:hypothetical protein